MRRIENHIPVERLDEFFICDAQRGVLIWREREVSTWQHKSWNQRFAGQQVGTPNTNGHTQVIFKIDGVKYSALVHRLIWAMTFREWVPVHLEIDHRNRNRSDNRLVNLRVCTRSENSRNTTLSLRNTSGFKGVFWYPRYNKWTAIIGYDGKHKNLGYFSKIEDAVEAYDNAAQRMFGTFSSNNRDLGLLAA